MNFKFYIVLFSIFLSACTVNTETTQSSSSASQTTISNILKGDYKAVYEDASVKMKLDVSEDDFLNTMNFQEKMYGKMVDSELVNESTGKDGFEVTSNYQYKLKNEQGEAFDLTLEFLKGHLIKSSINGSEWRTESEFVRSLVNPVKGLVFKQDSKRMYELLDKQYPEDQVQSLLQNIVKDCDGSPNLFRYSWTGNDVDGRMMVAFVYSYEGRGDLDFRFHIEKDNYPLAGVFFRRDENTKLP